MRSIGIKNKNMVKRLTIAEIDSRKDFSGAVESYVGVDQAVIDKLPAELWDTWEMADSEIRRLISDTIDNYYPERNLYDKK